VSLTVGQLHDMLEGWDDSMELQIRINPANEQALEDIAIGTARRVLRRVLRCDRRAFSASRERQADHHRRLAS